MGYLAPEYATIGRFTEKSDVYAFGILVFQILSGRRKITNSMRLAAESSKLEDLIDPNLHGRFTEREASKLAKVALSCTQDSPFERPSMDAVLLELGSAYVSYKVDLISVATNLEKLLDMSHDNPVKFKISEG
ncbi:Cold-responsive protein kinase 1-like protein [Drosera capensis]